MEEITDKWTTVYNNHHSVPYAALCQTFEQIEDTTKRLQILDYLVKFLISVIKLSPESLLTVIYLSINKVGLFSFHLPVVPTLHHNQTSMFSILIVVPGIRGT